MNVSKTPSFNSRKRLMKSRYAVASRGGNLRDALAGFFQVAVKADAQRLARHRVKRPRVHLDVFEAVRRESEFLHDRRASGT